MQVEILFYLGVLSNCIACFYASSGLGMRKDMPLIFFFLRKKMSLISIVIVLNIMQYCIVIGYLIGYNPKVYSQVYEAMSNSLLCRNNK